MATLRVRNLDETTMRELRARAAKHGRSVAEEALEILETELDHMFENDLEFRKALRTDAAKNSGKQHKSADSR